MTLPEGVGQPKRLLRGSTEAIGIAKEDLQSLHRGSKRHILCIQYGQKNQIQRINVVYKIEYGESMWSEKLNTENQCGQRN
jgi:hypothetical protein